jgi:hypothetical protein
MQCDPTVFNYDNVGGELWDSLPAKVARVEMKLARSKDVCERCNNMYAAHVARMQEACRVTNTSEGKDDYQPNEDEDEDRDNSDGDAPDVVEPTQTQSMPTHLRKNKLMSGARRRVDMPSRAPLRPHVDTLPLHPQRFQILRRNRFQEFDEYEGCPPLEDLHLFQRPGGLEGYPIDWDAQPTIRSNWELFRDHGYRLENEFALMFNQQEPLYVTEHLLPPPSSRQVPCEEDDEDDEGDDEEKEDDDEEEQKLPKNLVVLGMEEMLEQAGQEGSEASMNMFVKGITEDGNCIRMDPQRDEYNLSMEDYLLSMDIDSIIWITRMLRILSDLNVHVLPYQGQKPPISKNNHAYVEILMPPSNMDEKPRTEWYTVKRSLSVIPHTHFAKFSQGATTFNIYVMFPRMMHKNPLTNWTATNIPFEVQSRWLVDVVYPAIIAGENPSTMAYKDYTIEQWRWKASNNRRFGNAKTVPVKGANLPDILLAMRNICSSSDELARFGSHFFVLDARGTKESTTIIVREPANIDPDETSNFTVQEGQDLWVELCKKFTCLDWDYMMDRNNGGQLLVDLGMAFHPCAEDKTPLVCLWKLDEVKESYEIAGMTGGKNHYLNTFVNYGGKQAEMGSVRQRIVQLCHRLTYGLHYQPVRRGKGGDIDFCSDVDAYDANATFRKCCDDFTKMLLGGRKKNLGAREEVRGSGAAIKQVLKAAPELVCFVASLWFETKQ